MKKCKVCGLEKELSLMISDEYKCKECKNAARRTGYKTGPQRHRWSNTRKGKRSQEWAILVKERDKYKCQHCGFIGDKEICAHHIVRWEDSEELRFSLDNGLTLCNACHLKEHLRLEPRPGISSNKGRKWSDEIKAKMSAGRKGKGIGKRTNTENMGWPKGKKLSEDHKKKLSDAKKGKSSHMLGKKHSDETKAKISASKLEYSSKNEWPTKGRKFTAEHKQKLSEAKKGRHWIFNEDTGKKQLLQT